MEKARLSKFESNNCTKAQHLNSIVARSLVINLEQIQKDHVHQYKNRLTEKNNTENDLASIVYSTENISNKIFDGSRYKNLMKPVEHVSLASIIAERKTLINIKFSIFFYIYLFQIQRYFKKHI